MRIDDLQLLSEDETRDVLARAGLKELQLRKVMHAVTPPPAASSRPKAAASLPAVRPSECEWAELKKDGFTARELRLAGCDLETAKTLGYDAFPLVSAFGYDAVVASGVDFSRLVLVSFLLQHAIARSE
jgi:hypothetical protein